MSRWYDPEGGQVNDKANQADGRKSASQRGTRNTTARGVKDQGGGDMLSLREKELLHELQVHKLELEMQNESLRQLLVALEDSRDRYVDLYDFSPIGYLTLDGDAVIREINLTGASLLGQPRGEILNRPFSLLVAPEDLTRWRTLFTQATQHGDRSSGELMLRGPDGAHFVAQLECLRAADADNRPAVRMALTDISERKQADAVRQDTEARYRAIFNHALDGIVLAEVETRKLCSPNETFLRMTGYTEEEVERLRVDDIHPTADLPWIMERFTQQARGEIAIAENMPVLCRDGSIFYADVNTEKLVLNGKRYLLGEFRDVTERRLAESRVRHLSIQLAKTEERERREITQNLHDDLGQLLAIAKLRLSSIDCMEHCRGHEDLMRQVRTVEEMVDRANRSIRSLGMQLSPPALSREGLLPALAWLAEEMRRDHGVHVTVHAEGHVPLLNDTLGSLLFRAVRELLLNAAKHAQVVAADVSLVMEGETLVISVADEGCGFAPGQSQPFSTESGFGLFSVSERIELIGGSMQIDSRPGDGTLVVLTLPSASRWDMAEQ